MIRLLTLFPLPSIPSPRYVAVVASFATVLVGVQAVAKAAQAVTVQAVHIDGTTISGEWIGSLNGHTIELKTVAGTSAVPIDDLSVITVNKRTATSETSQEGSSFKPVAVPRASLSDEADGAVFHLAGDAHLRGYVLGPSQQADTVLSRTVLGDHTPLPFDQLAGIQLADGADFPQAYERFRQAMADRLPGEDVFITRTEETVKTLRGRLVSLDARHGSFIFTGRPRTFPTEKMFGVVFAVGAGRPESTKHHVLITLTDGSSVPGRMEQANADSIRLATSLGWSVDIPLDEVLTLRVHSHRVVYVSDLTPVAKRIEGLLHRAWPLRIDRNVSGALLAIGGRRFEKGLGVHSKTELTFDVGAGYETFVATIGIDDAVRPRGSVVYRVVGDGRVLFDSGLQTGYDAPQDVMVPISGLTLLTLVVDYGENLDLADHADWGGARLLKPALPPGAAAP